MYYTLQMGQSDNKFIKAFTVPSLINEILETLDSS